MSEPTAGPPPLSDEQRKRLRYLPRDRWPQEVLDWQNAWVRQNRAAIESSNRWVEKNGLPLAEYRMF